MGKKPLRLDKEFPGFLADRLLEAVWREALHLIAEGLVTVAEVDAAMADGPGLRWAIFGPMLTYHLGGGPGGMAHFLDQFGPTLDLPWSYMDPPELTPVLRERLIMGCENEANGRSIPELEHERDQCLIGILDALQKVRQPHQAIAQRGPSAKMTRYACWTPASEIGLPLNLFQCTVTPDWIDYNGHMTEGAYLIAFGYASDALFRYIGIDEAYRAAGYSFYTVETHINFYREVGSGEPLRFTTQLLGLDQKRLHLFHSMCHGTTGNLLATTEQMLVHVDMNASSACVIKTAVFDALSAIIAAHKRLPIPKQVGRQMTIN
ncbi:MAG: thioesterase family protein [Anaerolineae bacterium]